MHSVAYIISEKLAKASSKLPSNRNRSILVHSLVQSLGLLRESNVRVLTPTPATPEQLCTFHDEEYIKYLLDGAARDDKESEYYGLVEDCPYFEELPEYTQLVAGASLTAARSLISGERQFAIVWDGGRHHAQKSKASGFCYINDCVLSILQLRKSKPGCRVLYLDLDLHYSDAVSTAFASSSSILTISVHHRAPGFYPPSPNFDENDPYNICIPLAAGSSDDSFSRLWPRIEAIKEAFRPDYVVLQCGLDGLAGDPCKVWNWSLDDGEGSLAWCIRRVVSEWNVKTLFLGGGGYDNPNAARAWTYLTSLIIQKPLSTTSSIPDAYRYFPLFAPSFTIDIPKGNVQRQDSDIQEVLERLERHIILKKHSAG